MDNLKLINLENVPTTRKCIKVIIENLHPVENIFSFSKNIYIPTYMQLQFRATIVLEVIP